MAKFINVTPKGSHSPAWINTDYIITVFSENKETHLTVADLDKTIVVNETVEEVMKFIREAS